MTSDKNGKQTIGCRVTSCKHNMSGCDCELSRIEIEPQCGCHTGEPCDESLCGSYKSRPNRAGQQHGRHLTWVGCRLLLREDYKSMRYFS